MNICPRSQRTYSDDNRNFCLEDGSVLTQAASQAPPTVFQQTPQTSPQAGMPSQSGGQQGWNAAPQQQYSMQPAKKSSKTWIWVLLFLVVLVLLCGGGGVGLYFLGQMADKNGTATTSNSSTSNSFTSKSPTPTNTSNSTTTTNSSRTNVEKVDISGWVKEF